MAAARACSAASSSSDSAARGSTRTPGWSARKPASASASAGSAGTAMAQAASRLKKRPCRASRCASGSRLKSRAGAGSQPVATLSTASPSSPNSSVSSAGAGERPARSSRAAGHGEVVEARALELGQQRGGLGIERQDVAVVRPASAPSSSCGGSPESVRTTNAPPPSWGRTVTSPRQRSASVSHASTSSLGSSSGKRPSTASTAFAARGCAGTRQCLRRQSNQRPGTSRIASFSSSSNGKAKTSSTSRGSSARSQTRPPAGAGSVCGASNIEQTSLARGALDEPGVAELGHAALPHRPDADHSGDDTAACGRRTSRWCLRVPR